jgi:hypothetical protein
LTDHSENCLSINEKQDISQETEYRQKISKIMSGLLIKLEQFLTTSEDDFLTIGSKLRYYQSLCSKLNNLAKNIIQAIGTDIFSAGIDELGYLLNTIGDHLTNSSETVKKDKLDLQNIYAKLSLIENELVGFDKIVKTLRMLSISSKVESARLNIVDGGFYLLAETVDNMSTEIGEQKNAIKIKSKNLLQQLDKSIMTCQVFRQNRKIKILHSKI